jgi:hypothetical protein
MRSGLLAVVLAVASVAEGAAPAAGAAPSGEVLAARVTSGVAVDLDLDGSAEIVAVRPGVASSMLEVEAWAERDGGWESLGVSPVLVADGPGAELRQARVGADAGSLLVTSVDDRPRPVLASAPIDGDGLPACCLTLFDVALVRGSLALEKAGDGLGLATSVRALDLQADGTHELIVTGSVDPAGPEPPFDSIQLLRRVGAHFVADPVLYPEGAGSLAAIGDSDGVSGDDVHFLTTGSITRMTWDGSTLQSEAQPLTGLINAGAGGWIGGATGGVIVAVDGDRSLAVASWPRGGSIVPNGRVPTGPFPSIILLGDGPRARIVELTGVFPVEGEGVAVRIHDLGLRRPREIAAPAPFQALWDAAVLGPAPVGVAFARARPAIGPVSGGSSAVKAFLAPGTLVELDASGGLTVRNMRAFAGDGAMARAGNGAGWLVSGLGWNSVTPSVGYLIGGEPGTELRVVPMGELTGDDASADLDLSVQGATVVDRPEGPTLYASDDGFSVTVRADPEAWVLGLAAADHDAAPASDGSVTLELDPAATLGDDATFTATIIVLDPSGVAHVATWDGVLMPGAPMLRADSTTEPLSAAVTVTGSVSAGSAVSVDGVAVPVDADGRFRATLEAPVWGRDVVVVASDTLGQASTVRLVAIGFVDVRRLPWLPMIGVATMLIGALLFVRTPRQRSAGGGHDGDARLEEIEADPP